MKSLSILAEIHRVIAALALIGAVFMLASAFFVPASGQALQIAFTLLVAALSMWTLAEALAGFNIIVKYFDTVQRKSTRS